MRVSVFALRLNAGQHNVHTRTAYGRFVRFDWKVKCASRTNSFRASQMYVCTFLYVSLALGFRNSYHISLRRTANMCTHRRYTYNIRTNPAKQVIVGYRRSGGQIRAHKRIPDRITACGWYISVGNNNLIWTHTIEMTHVKCEPRCVLLRLTLELLFTPARCANALREGFYMQMRWSPIATTHIN